MPSPAHLKNHHKVPILDEAITASVTLSSRYITGRLLPDKSVSLLDTACARVALSQSSMPGVIEDVQQRILSAKDSIERLERENASVDIHTDRLQLLYEENEQLDNRLNELNQQWEKEKELSKVIADIVEQIDNNYLKQKNTSEEALSKDSVFELKQKLEQVKSEMKAVQGENPLVQASVNEQAIAEVVSNWTGIPVGKMVSDEINAILKLKDNLENRVIGQPHVLEAVAQAIRTSRAGLTDPRKPVGVFLFVGTSGVGKTETALALAEALYGGEQNITTINMSEFKEEHKVSMLLGSPPGYIGYGEGGVLTEAARRKPHSVILLDEMEKAHQGVQDIFYNLFDKGTIKDGEGRDIDFKNCVIIMTSNAGEEAIRAIHEQVEDKELLSPENILDNIRPYLLKHFKPSFLGRTHLVAFNPLDDENLVKICGLNMRRIEKRVKSHYGAAFSYDNALLLHVVARCQEADTGARNIENILNQSLLPSLASQCLDRLSKDEEINQISVGVNEEEEFTYTFS